MRNAAHSPLIRLANTPIERRERRPVTLSGFAAFADGSTAEILVLDLSYDGCGIESPVELTPGQALTLSVLRRGAIKAEVRWYSKPRAGLVFHAEPVPPGEHRPRVSERYALTAEVRMRRLGKPNYAVPVFDLSPTGCQIELVERPNVGEHVMVKLDGLQVIEAELCWIDGFRGGLRFERPIHPAVFDLLIARLTAAD